MAELPKPINHTVDAIYAALAARTRTGDNRGVAMANASNECERAVWYALRWAHPPEEIDGPKARRFETGFAEEDRLLNDLEAAGFGVERVDPATGEQFRVELANGWLRGRLDGKVVGLTESPETVHVVECKSHNDRSFKDLLKHAPPKGDGLVRSKPAHYAQTQLYMYATGLKRALYIAVNKNTDELYAERIRYNYEFCRWAEDRIAHIARQDRAPSKLYDDPNSKAAFVCQWCPALAVCHEGAWARRNCRTCLHADFCDGAFVHCSLHDRDLSYAEQQAGCADHLYLPDLVPGEQIDAGDRWVTYQLNNQKRWTDGENSDGIA